VEVPVSQIEDVGECLRHLQLCAVSFRELREALLHARRNDHPVTTIVSHSFELATRDGVRRNGTVCRRFEALCSFLAANVATLPTAHFSDLSTLRLGVPASPFRSRALRKAQRLAEQLWAEARYERPSASLTAFTGGSITVTELIAPYVG
jgi:hypothetical protein